MCDVTYKKSGPGIFAVYDPVGAQVNTVWQGRLDGSWQTNARGEGIRHATQHEATAVGLAYQERCELICNDMIFLHCRPKQYRDHKIHLPIFRPKPAGEAKP